MAVWRARTGINGIFRQKVQFFVAKMPESVPERENRVAETRFQGHVSGRCRCRRQVGDGEVVPTPIPYTFHFTITLLLTYNSLISPFRDKNERKVFVDKGLGCGEVMGRWICGLS